MGCVWVSLACLINTHLSRTPATAPFHVAPPSPPFTPQYIHCKHRHQTCTRTHTRTLIPNAGVKYLHHEAKAFDIGVYFEANGHGTVLFRPSLLQRLQDMDEQVGVEAASVPACECGGVHTCGMVQQRQRRMCACAAATSTVAAAIAVSCTHQHTAHPRRYVLSHATHAHTRAHARLHTSTTTHGPPSCADVYSPGACCQSPDEPGSWRCAVRAAAV